MVLCLLTAKTSGDVVNKQKCAVVTLKGHLFIIIIIIIIVHDVRGEW
jgi:hypothetical protein